MCIILFVKVDENYSEQEVFLVLMASMCPVGTWQGCLTICG